MSKTNKVCREISAADFNKLLIYNYLKILNILKLFKNIKCLIINL